MHGSYWTDIFPPMMIPGLGLVFVGVQIAGNTGVPHGDEKATLPAP